MCQQSTEFHFPSIDDQLEKIREGVKETTSWRQEHWIAENLSISSQQVMIYLLFHSLPKIDLVSKFGWYLNFFLFVPQWRRASNSGALRSGDVYVTRHSNLNEVHAVFHMVIDDSLRSSMPFLISLFGTFC